LTDKQQPLDKLKAKAEAAEKHDVITVAELAEMYPNQVAEIVTAAKADLTAEEFGDLKPADVEAAFPDAVAELVIKATAGLAEKIEAHGKELKDAVTKAKKDGQTSILKLSASKFAKLKETQKDNPKKG